MKYILVILALSTAFLPTNSAAQETCKPTCNNYADLDHFSWQNYDDDVHLLMAYSLTLTGGLVLEHKVGLPRWESALIMTIVTGMIGTAKETLHDEYTSRTDIKTWWAGAAAAGLTMTVLQF